MLLLSFPLTKTRQLTTPLSTKRFSFALSNSSIVEPFRLVGLVVHRTGQIKIRPKPNLYRTGQNDREKRRYNYKILQKSQKKKAKQVQKGYTRPHNAIHGHERQIQLENLKSF